ncbi:MAG: hypothetical protein Q4B82_08880 [Alysiella sp.]|nr:hypothetical protein [Alysiella sp.]
MRSCAFGAFGLGTLERKGSRVRLKKDFQAADQRGSAIKAVLIGS